MAKAPLLVIAAGGTGGHMFPAQALAEAMLRKGWRVKLSTDVRGARYTGGFPHTVEIEEISSATFARGGALSKIAVPIRIGAGIVRACFKMLFDTPAVVVGFGGYPAIPAMAAAWILRKPRMIHEQNGVLGRVNQIFAKRVGAVACGTWPTELPRGVSGTYTGNPVRAAVLEKVAAPYTPPGRIPSSVLVMGGSQGAKVLSDVVPPAIASLPEALTEGMHVSHQARDEDIERVKSFYLSNGIDAEVMSFFTDVPRRMAAAQLVISRAGASSIADISVIGRPSILVPLAAAIRDEQTANARGLVEAQAAILVPEDVLTPEALSEQIALVLTNPEGAYAMAQAALGQGRADATERLVAIVEELKK